MFPVRKVQRPHQLSIFEAYSQVPFSPTEQGSRSKSDYLVMQWFYYHQLEACITCSSQFQQSRRRTGIRLHHKVGDTQKVVSDLYVVIVVDGSPEMRYLRNTELRTAALGDVISGQPTCDA